ncbi:MAG: hypothetical protein MJZ15_01885 [Bacteroidales bacterium]|nr:hypothetical protein [Bacteroidales bacterium]
MDSALRFDADTLAFEMLDAIGEAEIAGMCDADVALYAVLVTQVLDRMNCAMDDSLVQLAVDYYQTQDADDEYHEGLAYYYMGHLLMERNDISSLIWYAEAKEKFVKCQNLRYEFLCWNFMGYVTNRQRDLVDAINFYREGLKRAREINNNHYVFSECTALARCYSLMGNTDSAHYYLDPVELDQSDVEEWMWYVYTIKGQISLSEKNYKDAIAYCDSAEIKKTSNGFLSSIMAELYLNIGKYAEALKCVRRHEAEDVYELALMYEQLSDIYEARGSIDSSLYYNKLYVALCDSIEIMEGNTSAAVTAIKNRKTIVKEERQELLVIVMALVVMLGVVVAVMYLRQKRSTKQSEREIMCLKDKLFLQIQNANVQREYINDSVDLILKMIGREVVVSISKDELLTQRQKVKIIYTSLDKYLPNVSKHIVDYYDTFNEDDVVCLVGNALKLSYSNIASIIIKSESCVNMKLRRMYEKMSEQGINKCDYVIKQYIFDTIGVSG